MPPLSTTHSSSRPTGFRCTPGAFLPERAGRFLCPNETPLRLDLRLSEPEQFYDRVGSPKASLRDLQAVEPIVANVIEAGLRAPGMAIFYSRDRNYYSQPACRRYIPDLVHLSQVMRGVAWLEAQGLAEHQRTAPSPHAQHRSRLRAQRRIDRRLR